MAAQAWPYQEATRLAQRNITGRPALFATGYGPSGLPHIGTFAEVARTTMVRRAYEDITGLPTRLIVFSDDMDALRKVPDNVPNQEMLRDYIGFSLTSVPDPFGTHESFAHHNNAMLCEFLDRFGFEHEFMSSTDCYESGMFDETLLNMARNYERVHSIILPTLGEDRRASYCCFMPRLPNGYIVSDGVRFSDQHAGLVNFTADYIGPADERYQEAPPEVAGRTSIGYNPNNVVGEFTFDVRGGNGKMQWKADWALRWMALGVDYEMAGKDLIDSVSLSGKIVRALGHQPPVGFNYEMFLDKDGHKISKSLGNGLTIDEWLTYGPQESLQYFLYREPRKAKNLHAGLIPRAVEDYWDSRQRYGEQPEEQRRGNPVHHIHSEVPFSELSVSYTMLLNLIGIMGEADEQVIWDYLCANYVADPGEEVRRLIPFALAYHRDHLAGQLVRRVPTDDERTALWTLASRLEGLDDSSAADLQSVVYQVGKDSGYADRLRDWFRVIYEVVFGSEDGPRLGGFIEVYGVRAFIDLLRRGDNDGS